MRAGFAAPRSIVSGVRVNPGDPFPDVSLPDVQTGEQVALRTFFDRSTCIFVWASW